MPSSKSVFTMRKSYAKWLHSLRPLVVWALFGMMMTIGTTTLEAQPVTPRDTIVDTMVITIRGNLASVEIAMVDVFVIPMRVGQQGNLVARAVDEIGDPVDADFFWTVSDTTKLRLEVTSDSTATITALQKTEWDGVTITLRAVERTRVAIAAWRTADGAFLGWDDEIRLDCHAYSDGQLAYQRPRIEDPELRAEAAEWCSAQLCAYALRGDRMVFQSDPPPTCPLLFDPVAEPVRPLSDRIVPFYALAANVRPGASHN